MTRLRRDAFTLVELLVVVVILAVLIAVLLPMMSRVRRSAMLSKLKETEGYELRAATSEQNQHAMAEPTSAPVNRPLAQVKSFDADVVLTPRLSVGTADPESIYEAKFSARIQASRTDDQSGEHVIQLPLPPQIISLSDLSVKINGEASDAVKLQGDKLIWQGNLSGDPAAVDVTYTAMGRGLYALQTPPAKILDHFKIALTAKGSDVRMLELSMQPTSTMRTNGATNYVWDYKRLMFGRPIALDVLGIAPIDRLGELSWLGPTSVICFGLLLGLMARAYNIKNFDLWMLLLVIGTFTGAFPLMYFAQEFIPLNWAMAGSMALVLIIIAVRSISIMGPMLGILGVTFPAGMIMALCLAAAVHPNLQGILLTGMVIGLFVITMMLAPRLKLSREMLLPPVMPQPA